MGASRRLRRTSRRLGKASGGTVVSRVREVGRLVQVWATSVQAGWALVQAGAPSVQAS